jgi:transcriptional regulator with XRE-family HTH domain
MFKGRKLKILREAHGLSQKKLVNLINDKFDSDIAVSTYGYWELNKINPKSDHAYIIAKFYNVNMEAFH